jgi:hypothetical protein
MGCDRADLVGPDRRCPHPRYVVGRDTISRLASPGAPLATMVRAAFIVYGTALVILGVTLRKRSPASACVRC